MGLNLLAVAIGGALGASIRYLTNVGFAHLLAGANPFYPFPISTMGINTIGCFAMGFLASFFTWHDTPVWKNFATVGLLGGFTTLSTFGLETIHLIDNASYGVALLNVTLTLFSCLLGIVFGRMLAHTLFPGR